MKHITDMKIGENYTYKEVLKSHGNDYSYKRYGSFEEEKEVLIVENSSKDRSYSFMLIKESMESISEDIYKLISILTEAKIKQKH